MKRFGYKPAFAGRRRGDARSMGGQIMPPVMGAVAFIMAETINVPYVEICKAAAIPATALFRLRASGWFTWRRGGQAARHCRRRSVRAPGGPWCRGWYLVLPLADAGFLLFSGYTPLFSGMVGAGADGRADPRLAWRRRFGCAASLRIVFWIVLGLACAAFFKFGVGAVMCRHRVLVAALLRRQGRPRDAEDLRSMRWRTAHGTPCRWASACALVGVIIGVLTLTGAATNFAGYIISIGEKSVFLSLLLTMVVCLVLGMGIPTIPNYIITSSLAAPALLQLGVPLIVSHMFVFYFGIMADLTPPVALAAFAAAPFAGVSA